MGENGTVIVSRDGVTWQSQTSGVTTYLTGVTWAEGLFVAVGLDGSIITSSDGSTWSLRRPAQTIPGNLLSVTWGAGRFVAVGTAAYSLVPPGGTTGQALASDDGITWSDPVRVGSDSRLYAVGFGGGQFVAAGAFDETFTSPDGVVWTHRHEGPGVTDGPLALAFGAHTWIAVGGSTPPVVPRTALMTSPDGVTWTYRTRASSATLHGIMWNGRQFVAVGDSGTITASLDGSTWSAQTSPVTANLTGITARPGNPPDRCDSGQ